VRNALAVIAADAGRVEAAYEHVSRAIEIARVSGPAAYLAHCYATRAEVALKAKDPALARSSAEAAIAAVAERGADADRAVVGAGGTGERVAREAFIRPRHSEPLLTRAQRTGSRVRNPEPVTGPAPPRGRTRGPARG